MKTSTKVILIVSITLVVAGILILAVAFLLGGRFRLIEANRLELSDYSKDFPEQIDSLYVELGAGEFTVKAGESFRVEAENIDLSSFVCEVENGTLRVVENWRGLWARGLLSGLVFSDYTPVVTIYIPADFHANRIELKVSAGELALCDLSADYFGLQMSAGTVDAGMVEASSAEVELSAGNAEIEGISATSAEINASAGAITVDALSAADLDLGVSAGAVSVYNITSERVSAECSAGKMNLSFLNPQDYYYIEMDISAGAVVIDGNSYSHGTSFLGSRDSKASIELETSAGQIDIDFK